MQYSRHMCNARWMQPALAAVSKLKEKCKRSYMMVHAPWKRLMEQASTRTANAARTTTRTRFLLPLDIHLLSQASLAPQPCQL